MNTGQSLNQAHVEGESKLTVSWENILLEFLLWKRKLTVRTLKETNPPRAMLSDHTGLCKTDGEKRSETREPPSSLQCQGD